MEKVGMTMRNKRLISRIVMMIALVLLVLTSWIYLSQPSTGQTVNSADKGDRLVTLPRVQDKAFGTGTYICTLAGAGMNSRCFKRVKQ